MTKEQFEKKSSWWIGKKLLNGLFIMALATTIACSSNNWDSKKVPKTTTEQTDKDPEKIIEKDWVVKNSDWSYSIYQQWMKRWESYQWIESHPWIKIFQWYKDDGTQCLLNEAWDAISQDYSNIFDVRKTAWKLEFIAWKNDKYIFVVDWVEFWPYDMVYPLTLQPYKDNLKWFSYRIWDKDFVYFNWNVVWPFDDFDNVRLLEWTENWLAIMAKNDWQNVLYYNENIIWKFPLTYSSDQCALTLWSLKLLNNTPCYIVYDTISAKIIYWEKTIETNYEYIDNVQEHDWEIIYVWWKSVDGKPDEIYIVVGDKPKKLDISESDIEKLTDPKTSLAFYATYWYFHD